LARCPDANGVSKRNLVAAHLVEITRDAHHIGQGNLSLVGAAEHGGDVAADAHAVGPGASHHGRKALQRLVDRGVDVVLVEGLGGGGEHRDLLHPDRAGTLVAFFVGNQYRVMHARSAGDAGIDLGGVGQLRHPLRADEAGRLDAPQPGGGEAVDQGDLVGGGDRRLLVLQPVARADLDDADRRLHAASAFSSATSTASASMKSPAAARTSATVPARGAFKLSSIFIASITISSWPASTTSPAATRATTTRPGIGASTRSVAAPAAVP